MNPVKKWRDLLQNKHLLFLSPLETQESGNAILRSQKLLLWKAALIAAAAKELSGEEFAAFREEADKKTAAAVTLLTGQTALPLLKNRKLNKILHPVAMEKVPRSILQEVRSLFPEVEGPGPGAGETLFTLLDGKRTLFDAAKYLWALQPFRKDEEKALEEISQKMADLAETLLQSEAYELQILPLVTKEDIIKGLRELGLKEGDMVMTHSSLKGFGIVEGGAETVISALQSVLTEKGILALPGLSLCVDGSPKAPYHPETSTIESWVGTIPETFRKLPGVLRSSHPTHSVCAWGEKAEEFLSSSDPMDVFAKDGPWGKLARENGKILFLGDSTTGNTFLHACEAWYGDYLDYTVAKVQKDDGSFALVPVKNYPGGCRGGWYPLRKNAPYYRKLEEMQIFRYGKVGNAVLTLADAASLADAIKKLLEEDPAIFLHKSGCPDCARIRGMIYWKKNIREEKNES